MSMGYLPLKSYCQFAKFCQTYVPSNMVYRDHDQTKMLKRSKKNHVLAKSVSELCSEDTPDYAQCRLDYLKSKILAFAPEGIPLLGIQRSEPYELPYITIDGQLGDNAVIVASMKDIKVQGFTDVKVEDFR